MKPKQIKKKKYVYDNKFQSKWLETPDINGDLIGLWARKIDDYHFM